MGSNIDQSFNETTSQLCQVGLCNKVAKEVIQKLQTTQLIK
jgi:hypothetical protein